MDTIKSKERKLAVAYARYSSSNQREESIEEQVMRIQDYADSNNINIIKQYTDYAKSGSKNLHKREEFLNMIDDITSKKIEVDYVLVYCLSRFMRNRYESAIYRKKLADNNVKLISITEAFDDGPESVILESVLEGMAEYFSRNLSREVMRGLHYNAINGLFTGGQPPLGYKVVDMKLVVNEDERPIIEYIFNSYVEGHSLASIARELNARGYKTRAGKSFTPNSFYDLISNEKYIGTYVFNKTASPSLSGKRNGHKQKSDEDIIRIEDCFEGIISKEVFAKAQEIKKSKRYDGGRAAAKHNYLLSGLIYCGECSPRDDGQLYSYCGNARKSRGKYKEYISYRCSNRKNRCTNKEIRKEYVEEFVLNELEKTIFNERSINYIVKGMNRNFSKQNEKKMEKIKSIDKNISMIDNQISNLFNAIKEGIFDSSFNDELKKLRDKKFQLETLKKEEEKKIKKTLSVTEDDVQKLIDQFKDYIKYRNLDECKKFIHRFVNKVIIYRNHIEVEYKFSLNIIDDSSTYIETKNISRNDIIDIYQERYAINDMNDYLHQRVMQPLEQKQL